MLKVLLKKQITEVFKSYFYDAKKNKMRSKAAIAGWIIFFFLIMVGMLGGIFTFLSLTLCKGLVPAGLGWLYFLVMGGIAILLGAFGSVFNTYSGLYLARDNDLLLSMPIPAGTIIASRLMNVYLMGAMYSAVVFIPALAVYTIVAGAAVLRLACGVIQFLIITVIVLLLSCVLGWVVAKISLRLKNKSLVTVLVSLLFIGGYYFFYFRASDMISDMILNAAVYGEKIKGSAYGLYLFGRIGEGDLAAAAVFAGGTAVISALVWLVLSRSFLNIVTSGGSAEKARYVEKPVKEKSVFGALLGKELGRFVSSSSYMLNCGLGILLIPACGVLLLVKGSVIVGTLDEVFSARTGTAEILICTLLCGLAAMNDMAAPSVSLEGKSLWIPQSLPVFSGMILRAKAAMQLILTAPVMLFAVICAVTITGSSAAVKLLICLMPLIYTGFNAVFGTFLGIRMPILNWTDETAPIKQGAAVMIALFGNWFIIVVFAVLYLWVGYTIGIVAYLAAWTALFALAGVFLLHWLDTCGSRKFAELP